VQSVATLRVQALRLLARREHSRFELQRKLRVKGAALADIHEVLQQLQADGLQSDERFTEGFIRSCRRRGLGPERIRAELYQRQVDDTIIATYLCYDDEEQWVAAARQVIQKKSCNQFPKVYAQRVKLMNFLQYRGFNSQHIKAAMAAEEQHENG
jgi:regulatory protein